MRDYVNPDEAEALPTQALKTDESRDQGDDGSMWKEVEFLKHVYDRFNTRDMDSVLAAMHEDVIWANGMEGGHVHGRDEVRSYWNVNGR